MWPSRQVDLTTLLRPMKPQLSMKLPSHFQRESSSSVLQPSRLSIFLGLGPWMAYSSRHLAAGGRSLIRQVWLWHPCLSGIALVSLAQRGGNFSFGLVFRLKMIIGFNFVPSARQERTTVKWDFSWPVVVMETVFSPRVLIVLVDGMSNQTGVSSILTMFTSS